MANNKKNKGQGLKQICQHRQENLKYVTEQFHYLRNLMQRADRNLARVNEQDINKIKFEILDKCLRHLKQYIDFQNHKNLPQDPMLSSIDQKLISFEGQVHIGPNERNWLQSKLKLNEKRIDDLAAQVPSTFSMSPVTAFQKSLQKFQSCQQKATISHTLLPSYLRTIEGILIGATLIMEDGIKYYNNQPEFSVNSIKAGAYLFVTEANKFLSLVDSSDTISL